MHSETASSGGAQSNAATPSEFGRWTPEFIDFLAKQTDPLADDYFNRVLDEQGQRAFSLIFSLKTNDDAELDIIFPEISKFLHETRNLPEGTDLERIARGELAFEDNMYIGALVLLAKSLPEGYCAPNLARVLNISKLLQSHPYKRLLATLQMVMNVATSHSFEPKGLAVITAQKLRLWHSAIRYSTPTFLPDFAAMYGVPVSQLDMLATIIGLSYLVILGWRTLHADLTTEQENDYYYVWKIFAMLFGIHPPGEPNNFSWIPDDVEDAGRFYAAYANRCYVDSFVNPDGVELAAANLHMLQDMIPDVGDFLGLKKLPEHYMLTLMGEERCDQLALPMTKKNKTVSWLLEHAAEITNPIEKLRPSEHFHLGNKIFEHMIEKKYDGRTAFIVPKPIADILAAHEAERQARPSDAKTDAGQARVERAYFEAHQAPGSIVGGEDTYGKP